MDGKFKLGALFPDKKTLELDIKTYQKEKCVNLWKKHSRSIASEVKRTPGLNWIITYNYIYNLYCRQNSL